MAELKACTAFAEQQSNLEVGLLAYVFGELGAALCECGNWEEANDALHHQTTLLSGKPGSKPAAVRRTCESLQQEAELFHVRRNQSQNVSLPPSRV